MLFACLSIEHLPIKAERARNPHLRGRPVILARLSGSQRVVLDASPEAAGVSPGMPLAEALSACADATLVEPDPTAYRRIFEDTLSALEALSADVEEEALGLAYVRLSGLELLHGGEDRLVAALLRAVPAYLAPRLGVAGNKFAAAVAAGKASPGRAYRAPDDLRSFLGPLSVGLLPVAWSTTTRLHGFGLRTLGQVAALPAGAMQAQFGAAGRLAWELANGIDPRPLLPRTHAETVEASLTFPGPVATLEAIVTAADSLLGRTLGSTRMRGRFARVCTLEGGVFRAPTWHKRMVFREPVGDRHRAVALVRHTLEGNPPPGPLEDLRVTLSGLTGEAGRQESLFSEVRKQENLKETLRQLHARLGAQPPIYQVREVEPWSRIPERRQVLVPFSP